VCLHCRKEARIAAKDRRQRLMLRGAAGAIVVATGLAATALGATAIRDKNTAQRSVSPQSTASTEPVRVPKDSAHATPDSATRTPAPQVAAQVVAEPVVTKPAAPAPVIQMGSSSIQGGISAERTDTAVTLSFDTPMTRTRRSDKFEQFVRATLPAIYGKKVDSILTAMPAGTLAKQGDLLTELPSRGMRIPVDSAWEIRVFPETRQGKDGLLVIRYRASAVAR
jgi:hypothetical protein